MLRIARLCSPALDAVHALTFQRPAGGDWSAAWTAWREGLFAATILPRLVATIRHAERQEALEICEVDRALHADLEAPSHQRSLVAGRQLRELSSGRRSIPLVDRLARFIDEGKAHGHFPTIYGVRSAAFNIPVRQALLSYVYHEWRTGLAASGAGCIQSVEPFVGLIEAALPSGGEAGFRGMAV